MMNDLLHSIFRIKNKIGHSAVIKFGVVMIVLSCVIGFTSTSAEAAAGLKIFNYSTNKTTTYTGKQIKVTCNGSTISKADTPGILVSDISMQPYDDVFMNSIIAADCSYDSKKGKITISKYGKKIVMTVGSKNATVNGKTVKLSIAPMRIKYVAANKIKVMVPSRFVSETLGLGYTWVSAKSTIEIKKKTVLLSMNGGAKTEYAGVQVQCSVNGKKVNQASMPGIIRNDTALIGAKSVFANSTIKANYSYDSKNKKISITKGKTVILMTIGSKTATINKVKKTLSTPPVLVKNIETGNSYVLVPGKFTATALGYQYKWNKAKSTSEITLKTSQEEPELGDSGDPTETGVILKQWKASTKNYSSSSGVHTLTSSSSKAGKLKLIYRDTKSTKRNSETYIFEASSSFGKITSSLSGKKLTIQAEQLSCTNAIQELNKNSTMVSSIKMINHAEKATSTLEMNLNKEGYQYDLSFSSNKQLLMVTVYTNALISAYIGTNSQAEYLVMGGLDDLQASLSEAKNTITIQIPNCENVMGDLLSQISGSKYIKKIDSVAEDGSTKVILTMQSGYTITTEQKEKLFKLILIPTKLPNVTDQSKYEIVIPLPNGVNASMVTDEDFYLKNYFVIRLKGDHRNFYKSKSIKNNSKTVTSISHNTYTAGNTEIKISTSKIQGYDIAIDSKNIYVNVGNPSDIYKNIVVLDPGHGGAAVGAKSGGYKEKDINFKILYTVGKKYFDKDPKKLKVYYTRTTDCDISLENRAAFASKVGADLFVSLHMNSATNAPSAKGTEVYYSSNNNKANKAGLTSKALASSLVSGLTGALGTKNRGVREAGFLVTKRNTVPAVLIELGFISNSSDLSMMSNSKKQDTAALTIYNTLLDIFKKYPC